jgi:hypothetical protein
MTSAPIRQTGDVNSLSRHPFWLILCHSPPGTTEAPVHPPLLLLIGPLMADPIAALVRVGELAPWLRLD